MLDREQILRLVLPPLPTHKLDILENSQDFFNLKTVNAERQMSFVSFRHRRVCQSPSPHVRGKTQDETATRHAGCCMRSLS